MGAHKSGAKGKKSRPGRPNPAAQMPYEIAPVLRTPSYDGEGFAKARSRWFRWLRTVSK